MVLTFPRGAVPKSGRPTSPLRKTRDTAHLKEVTVAQAVTGAVDMADKGRAMDKAMGKATTSNLKNTLRLTTLSTTKTSIHSRPPSQRTNRIVVLPFLTSPIDPDSTYDSCSSFSRELRSIHLTLPFPTSPSRLTSHRRRIMRQLTFLLQECVEAVSVLMKIAD